MIHQYVICDDDILTLDTAKERADARRTMRRCNVRSLPVLEGPAGEDGTPTGETLEAGCTACLGEGGDCGACDDDGMEMPELPTDHELAETLMAILNPETCDDDRGAMIDSLQAPGRMHMESFRGAGILTNNAGFVLTIGGTTFQITVVS